tara:strand:+ start:8258 stop:9412 length:1155 start_codon:yes stop_codon:yes gene_type:complete
VNNFSDPLGLAQALIRCKSITPKNEGALEIISSALTSLGFKCWRLPFSEPGTQDVDNLFARLGSNRPHLCFAGHVDVVPVGDLGSWTFSPFEATVHQGNLYGRGSVDMKGAIAAFVAGLSRYLEESENKNPDGSISLLITGDEEGPAINGTKKVLKWIESNNHKIDACIVGEPTNPVELGDMIKIGRRGSLNANLIVSGTQGHAAYPHLADNPVTKLISMLGWLTSISLDNGTDHFEPSNIEVTSIDIGNSAHNVIPSKAQAKFNVRFNDLHTGSSLVEMINDGFQEITKDFTLDTDITGEAFINNQGEFSSIISKSVNQITGKDPVLSTSGGTSDARFIKDYCPVIEFGLSGKTMHKIDENVSLKELEMLSAIYLDILKKFFL